MSYGESYHGAMDTRRKFSTRSGALKTTLSEKTCTGTEPLLCGYYNQRERHNNVITKFETAIMNMQKLDFSTDEQITNIDFGMETRSPRKEKSLEDFNEEINKLCSEVNLVTFEGQHFTREYRTLEGTCLKLLEQLDNLDCSNDTQLRTDRERAFQFIERIKTQLNGKVHVEGKCCKDCPLYGTHWELGIKSRSTI